jgi:hypothetical protein
MAADDLAAGSSFHDGYDRSPQSGQGSDGSGFFAASIEVQVPSPFTRARAAAAEIDDSVCSPGIARHKWRKIGWRGGSEWILPRQAVDQAFDRRHDYCGAGKRRGFAAPFDGNLRQRPLRQALDQRQMPLP